MKNLKFQKNQKFQKQIEKFENSKIQKTENLDFIRDIENFDFSERNFQIFFQIFFSDKIFVAKNVFFEEIFF